MTVITLIAAAALAAQTSPVGDLHAQHQQQGQSAQHETMGPEQMMADCKKCCEEMKGKHAEALSGHDEHAHQ